MSNDDNHNTNSSLSTEQSYELEGICDALTKFPQTGSSTKHKSFVLSASFDNKKQENQDDKVGLEYQIKTFGEIASSSRNAAKENFIINAITVTR